MTVEVNPDKEQIEKSINEVPELYYTAKTNLRLMIDQRFKPNIHEKDLIYQILKIHGIDWEGEE